MKISHYKINGKGHLVNSENKLVVIRIGSETFTLSSLRTLRNEKDLEKLVRENEVKTLL